ncbi:MAG: hypothetical protein CBD18_03520 [Opitutales bacterium TMED158]|nr:MAG: hypothetical protein CBD18_03520 [Opitutales bacterium TMED158]
MTVTRSVEEFQGLYGPYQVSELLIQKIWLRGAFDVSRLKDNRERVVEVIFPGRWNRLAGPDFKDAILAIDGERIEGDVEIHFGLREWHAHGHGNDPRYENVQLHVLYHPEPANADSSRTLSGREIPSVSLLPLLWYDLEAYALEDSLLESTGAGEDAQFESLFELGLEERRRALRERSERRWEYKRRFAAVRIERYGWQEACHLTAMEVMGYAANRIPMLWVAGACSLARMGSERPRVEQLWPLGKDHWSTTGCRPPNYPRRRLLEYLNWVKSVPDWPGRLECWSMDLSDRGSISTSTARFRRATRLGELKKRAFETVLGGAVSGAKLDTLICDGFLPLLEARNGVSIGAYWFHWHAGNLPDSIARKLSRLQVLEKGKFPMCNGWGQGILGAIPTDSGKAQRGQADA